MEASQSSHMVSQRYLERRDAAHRELTRLAFASQRMVWVRTALFCLAVFFLLAVFNGATPAWLYWSLFAVPAVAFVLALSHHEKLRESEQAASIALKTYEQLLSRTERRWKDLPHPPEISELDDLPLATDVDLVGEASLFRLVSLAKTPYGWLTIAQWMARTIDEPTACSRQQAVQALAADFEHRESYLLAAASLERSPGEAGQFLEWAECKPWLAPLHNMMLAAWVGTLLTCFGMLMVVAGKAMGLDWMLRGAGFMLVVGIGWNLLLTIWRGGAIHTIFQSITGGYHDTIHYQTIFEQLSELPRDNGLLDQIREQALAGDNSAKFAFTKLNRLVRLAQYQRDPKMFLIYIVLQLFGLWDFHVLHRLETWQQKYGDKVRGWFEAIGTYEALLSVSALAYENPAWAYPEFTSNEASCLHAEQLGHPLLPDTQRVSNDVVLVRNRPLLLVTGSNMAGKSTLLRSIGVNLVLARLGAPVCATRFASPLFEVVSSIRVRDSLQGGVSYFMSELKQLKCVVDIARAQHADHSAPVFFLLDEILQGTNSRERQIAVIQVLRHLLDCDACGIISTHDLELAANREIEAVCQTVHFREYFESVDGRSQMRFDYKMRPGPTPTTNALKLLEIVGLSDLESKS